MTQIHRGDLVETHFHRITTIRRPIGWCAKEYHNDTQTSVMIAGRPAIQEKAPPEKALRALWAGRYASFRGYEAFAPQKRECPHTRGFPRGRNPLGLLLSRGFLSEDKKSRKKNKRFHKTSFYHNRITNKSEKSPNAENCRIGGSTLYYKITLRRRRKRVPSPHHGLQGT